MTNAGEPCHVKTAFAVFGALSICIYADPSRIVGGGHKAYSARDVVDGYAKNGLAMETVEGKAFWVYGKVEKLGRDSDGKPYFLLEARDQLGAVKCVFAESDVAQLREMLGRQVIVRGVLRGSTLGIATMTECQFTK